MTDDPLSGALRRYRTEGGADIQQTTRAHPYEGAADILFEKLDSHLGVLLCSDFEYPGRYTRWDLGFYDPPLQVAAQGRAVAVTALNARGEALLPALGETLGRLEAVATLSAGAGQLTLQVKEPTTRFPEELRSRQHSVFSVLRALVALFAAPDDPHLGLYGAFGYDLAFQFEAIPLRLPRDPRQRDLVLYLPDRILVVDHYRQQAQWHEYDIAFGNRSTAGLPRDGAIAPYRPAEGVDASADNPPGAYADTVRKAKEAFRRGDLFEVVPGQTFFEPCPAPPSALFRRLRRVNPSPYGFLMNLGDSEYLVGSSPEMFVRVEARTLRDAEGRPRTARMIETCPISGTIARGPDAIGDARQILTLLQSKKDEAELTMCTDVDRNDKSRVCVPGSVRVIGRRQIEMYSRLIHTVDHVVGELADGFDALDGFLSHAWAVTVTGAPKLWAMRFIEEHEASPRRWYGGAVGAINFNGHMNTGLTLRTVRIADGLAAIRAGATLLYDSDPEAEDAECRLKASALRDAIRSDAAPRPAARATAGTEAAGTGRRLLLVDHQDSFVHTLANYFRQTGAQVETLRPDAARDVLAGGTARPDMVVLSPGPGRPEDFGTAATIRAALDAGAPIFGVCLGLQGLVEALGGRLQVLDYPMHGKATAVRTFGGRLFDNLPTDRFEVGRYHSIYAARAGLPAEFRITAETVTPEDGEPVIMAVEHTALPLAAVQFHPESIMTLDGEIGLGIVRNVVARLRAD
ncbi:MAG: anthranilate synthase component I [Alphaproteobacteria bacterium]|jgi:anthranilate synthase|nr:anthranilate synthase component I [Alphaproteobacteria bacterium]